MHQTGLFSFIGVLGVMNEGVVLEVTLILILKMIK